MDPNLLFSQITAGAALAYVLRLVQRWEKLPWITQHTQGITVLARLLLSFVATLGISWTWSAGDKAGHVLAIAIPSWTVLAHGLWHWFGQYALQHGWGQVLNIGTLQKIETPLEVKNVDKPKETSSIK